jgi:hypothetical protein
MDAGRMILYHYTCSHAAPQIEKDGFIRPAESAVFAWATDLYPPVREALGLTSHILKCDRMEHAFRVYSEHMVPWMEVRKLYDFRDALESAPGAMPMHWYVSPVAVPAVRLEGYWSGAR